MPPRCGVRRWLERLIVVMGATKAPFAWRLLRRRWNLQQTGPAWMFAWICMGLAFSYARADRSP